MPYFKDFISFRAEMKLPESIGIVLTADKYFASQENRKLNPNDRLFILKKKKSWIDSIQEFAKYNEKKVRF